LLDIVTVVNKFDTEVSEEVNSNKSSEPPQTSEKIMVSTLVKISKIAAQFVGSTSAKIKSM
jgi:hypothetical protein